MSEAEILNVVKCCKSIREEAGMGMDNVKLLGIRPKFSQD